jgi:hypothetical protein
LIIWSLLVVAVVDLVTAVVVVLVVIELAQGYQLLAGQNIQLQLDLEAQPEQILLLALMEPLAQIPYSVR